MLLANAVIVLSSSCDIRNLVDFGKRRQLGVEFLAGGVSKRECTTAANDAKTDLQSLLVTFCRNCSKLFQLALVASFCNFLKNIPHFSNNHMW